MDSQPSQSDEWPETATGPALARMLMEDLQDIRALPPGRARESQALTIQILLNRMCVRGWITAVDAEPLVDVLRAMREEQKSAENTAAGVPPLPANGRPRVAMAGYRGHLQDTTPSCC